MKKRVLIITYYWPPAGGVAVQRWLKHVKYLRDFGYEPVILTTADADYPVLDHTIAEQLPEGIEVIRVPIWEPYSIYKKFTGRKKEEKLHSGFIDENKKTSLAQQTAVFIRSNFFIPDARKFWVKPTVKFLKKYLAENKVAAIISNGTPHTCHVIGLKIKQAFPNIPWIADFRDPWTKIDYFDQLNLTSWALAKHKKLERQVAETADRVVTVSWHWKKEFEELSGKPNGVTINNGFDEADFLRNEPLVLDKKFTICHTGLMGKDRAVPVFWQSLQKLLQKNPTLKEDLQIELIGSVDYEVMKLIHDNGLDSYVKRIDFLPHSAVIKRIQEVQILLLVINESSDVLGRIPSKLYEYLGAKRPVLAIGPVKGDAAKIIKETEAGAYFCSDEFVGVADFLERSYEQFRNEALVIGTKNALVYSRRHLTGRYAEVLEDLNILPT